jgi:hypothetical protein
MVARIGNMMITGQISWALESCNPGIGAVAGGAAITAVTNAECQVGANEKSVVVLINPTTNNTKDDQRKCLRTTLERSKI